MPVQGIAVNLLHVPGPYGQGGSGALSVSAVAEPDSGKVSSDPDAGDQDRCIAYEPPVRIVLGGESSSKTSYPRIPEKS
jgi:hypothetical protein